MSQGELITGISQEAAGEMQRVLDEAARVARERRESAEKEASGIREEARRKASEQSQTLARQIASGAAMEVKRIGLRMREQAARRVLEQVRLRLKQMISSPEYRGVLVDWLTEAALGLSLPEAAVNASAAELPLIDEALLTEVQDRVRGLTGKQVRLYRADTGPLAGQGVVLQGRDGRLAYNNQVSTRLMRMETEVRRVMDETLWKNES